MLKFTDNFKELWEKSAFLKIADQTFEAEDFLNVLEFLRLIFLWKFFLLREKRVTCGPSKERISKK